MKKLLLTALVVVLACSNIIIAQSFPPAIDAEKDDWYGTLTNPDDGYVFIPSRAFVPEIGGAAEGGDADLSAHVWTAWDATYFYLYEEVSDDVINVNNGTNFQNDGIELKFDPDPLAGNEGDGISSARLTAYGKDNAADTNGVDDLNGDGDLKDLSGVAWVPTEDDFARRETDDGYALEMRIPWDFITTDDGQAVNVGEGDLFGLAINISDNDTDTRTNMAQWAANVTDFVWNDPTHLGSVTFLADNKLQYVAQNAIVDTVVNDSAMAWYYPSAGGSFPPVIDAERDAWYDGLTNPEDGFIRIPAAAFVPEIGGPADGGDADLSALVWTAWDETYFYLYEEVSDDVINVNNGTNFQNDGIELKFDPDPLAGNEGDGISSARLTAYGNDNAADTNGVDNLNGDADLKDLNGVAWEPTEDDYARRETDEGYALEMRIPWEFITTDDGQAVNVGEGDLFGLAINISDNDTDTRTNMAQWAANVTDFVWNDPTHLGTVTFQGSNTLNFEAVNAIVDTVVNDSAMVWYYPVTAIEVEPVSEIPRDFQLGQNYPNPFNPETTIQFSLEKGTHVSLAVYTVNGQLVNQLVSGRYSPGTYQLKWDGTDFNGRQVSSGVYFYRLATPDYAEARKMILMK